MRGFDADRLPGLAIGDDVIVFTGARTVAHDADGFIERARFFHDLAHELRHGLAIPVPFTMSAHFTDGETLVIHGGNTANKSSITNIHPRMPLIRLHDHDDGVGFQSHALHVVQDSAVIDVPVPGRCAGECKAGAVKKFREKIR